MKRTDVLIIFILITVLIILIAFLFWQYKDSFNLKRQLEEKNTELEKAQVVSRRVEELEKQNEELRQKEGILYSRVSIDEKQPFSLIRKILSIGNEIGLRGMSFDIKEKSEKEQKDSQGLIKGPPNKALAEEDMSGSGAMPHRSLTEGEGALMPGARQAPQPVKSQEASKAGPKPLYFQMEFEGTFLQFLDFLKRVSNLERVVTIDTLEIKRSKELLPYQKATLQLVTYTFSGE